MDEGDPGLVVDLRDLGGGLDLEGGLDLGGGQGLLVLRDRLDVLDQLVLQDLEGVLVLVEDLDLPDLQAPLDR